MRDYYVGHFRYNDMPRPKLAVERLTDIDSMPPTMLNCARVVRAINKHRAVYVFKTYGARCDHKKR